LTAEQLGGSGGLTSEQLGGQLDRTERHLRKQALRGYDPYDALCSPLFRLPVLRSNRLIRFGSQQTVKRLPIDVRPLLRVPAQLNAVTVALALQGSAYRSQVGDGPDDRRAEAERWVARLGGLVSPGWSGACWGYPFDWEGRYTSLPANTPTVVATGMVANALAAADDAFDLPEARALIRGAAAFVLNDLQRSAGDDGSFCWSYSPLDHQVVLNATLKGSRLLAQAHGRGADGDVLEPAARSARFVINHQALSGAWPYAVGDTRRWADNFHTGYVLECLAEYRRLSGDFGVSAALARGWGYYRGNFFAEDSTPKYYDDRVLPIDATACAQSVITLCAFGDVETAARAAARSVALLGLPDGSFAYQRRARRLVRIPFLRWSTAWMYCALARLSVDLMVAR
jgi:hypothetical protein